MDILKFLKKYTPKPAYQIPVPVHAPVPVPVVKAQEFKITDYVEWESYGSPKSGYVVDVVEAGSLPFSTHSAFVSISRFYRVMFDYPVKTRSVRSYLIATEEGPRGGKARLYWPKSKNLRKATK